MAETEVEAKVETEDVNSRTELVRDTIVLQLKLIVDGIRDLALMPICLFATLFGLIVHRERPGRYTYRILSYGRLSEKWIGLFDDADKDEMGPLEYEGEKFDDIVVKAQNAFESKYVDPEKKDLLVKKLNDALNDINVKVNKNKTSS